MTMQSPIQAVYKRGSISKGVVFRADWLLKDPASPAQVLLRVVGDPDPVVDWSGHCANLTSAVGPFAISLSPSSRLLMAGLDFAPEALAARRDS